MSYPGKTDDADTTAPSAPTNCPTCRSIEITTTSKVINVETYWRCGACGDVWNVGRRRQGTRYADTWSGRA